MLIHFITMTHGSFDLEINSDLTVQALIDLFLEKYPIDTHKYIYKLTLRQDDGDTKLVELNQKLTDYGVQNESKILALLSIIPQDTEVLNKYSNNLKEGQITIKILFITHPIYTINVYPSDTVNSVKEIIAKIERLQEEIEKLRLSIVDLTELQNDKLLSDYGVEDGSCIICTFKF